MTNREGMLYFEEPKKPDPLHPNKQHMCLVLYYQLLNRPITTTHNGNKVILVLPPAKHDIITSKAMQL